jgi:hypothetical protein
MWLLFVGAIGLFVVADVVDVDVVDADVVVADVGEQC